MSQVSVVGQQRRQSLFDLVRELKAAGMIVVPACRLSVKLFTVVELYRQGKTGGAIAAELNISVGTVEQRLKRATAKLHLRSRRDLKRDWTPAA